MTDKTAEPVCREWTLKDTIGETGGNLFVEHNALARAYLAQAKEIEGLTKQRDMWAELADVRLSEKKAAEARAAELVKVLERLDDRGGLGLDVHDRIRRAINRKPLFDDVALGKGKS